MATVANTSWYRTGSVEVTKNSATITGTNTRWTSAGINPGATFRLDEDLKPYEVWEVVSDTEITLRTPFLGTTGTGKTYSIDRNFQSTPMASLCAAVAAVMHKYETHIDAETNTVTGKSAYQIACDHGFVGTEFEWLLSIGGKDGKNAYELALDTGFAGTLAEWQASLLAAGEWAELQAKTSSIDAMIDSLGVDRVSAKNLLYSGKNLGEFTAEHAAQIKNGKYTGLGLGDYWTHNGKKYTIAAFNYYSKYQLHTEKYPIKHIIVWRESPLTWDEFDFPLKTEGSITYNFSGIGEEGEEGYMPSTLDHPYATSNWYANIRPKFITLAESIFTGNGLPTFLAPIQINVPTKAEGGATDCGKVRLSSKAHLPTSGMCFNWSMIHPRLGDGRNWGGMDSYGEPTPYMLPLFRAYNTGHPLHFAIAETVNTELASNGSSCVPFAYCSTRFAAGSGSTTFHVLRPIFCLCA